jgi:hypothetical protein
MKSLALAALLFFASIVPAAAQSYYDIDVDLPAYPDLQPVPDSPVYYAPGVDSNYFFYDGQYWDYCNDHWYTSAWYNGPWQYVDPVWVPTYVLWVPIRYYHRHPAYFRGWNAAHPPHWGEFWGADWQAHHNTIYGGHNGPMPARAPLPHYQRQYTRANYPRGAQQLALHTQHYNYQPQERVARPQNQQLPSAPAGQKPGH